jgi:hypothetical protein
MVGHKKESRLWDALNNTKDIFVAVSICKAFKITQDEEDHAISLWETKRTILRNSINIRKGIY